MIFSGFAEKYPDINWIWSHGGGSITSFYERFTVQALMRPPYKDKFTRDRVEGQIRRFYYDTAAIPNDVTLSALAKMVPASQILYGTDFPYRRAAVGASIPWSCGVVGDVIAVATPPASMSSMVFWTDQFTSGGLSFFILLSSSIQLGGEI